MIKYYLWTIIIVFIASAIGRGFLFFKSDSVSIIDLLEAALGLVNSIGLYGYLQKKYFLTSFFWYGVLVIGFGFGIYNIFYSPKTFELVEKVGKEKAYFILGVSYVLTAPHMYFLFLYAKLKSFQL